MQAWDLKFVRPEPLLIEKQMYKITYKSPIDIRQARAEADSEQMPKLTTSCHACTKPHVSGSYFFFQLNTISVINNGIVQDNQITVGPLSSNLFIN